MKNSTIHLVALLGSLLAGCGGGNASRGVDPVGPAQMVPDVVDMLRALYNEGDPSELRALAVSDLPHFSSRIGDGVDAWVEFAASVDDSQPLVAIHRTVAEGNTIGVHAQYSWNAEREFDGGPGVVVAHVFTVESGKIVSAIELTQPIQAETASGNDMFSSRRPLVPQDDPERSRATVERILTEFLPGDTSLKSVLLGDYVQHNPLIPDGADGIAGFVESIGGAKNEYRWTIVEGGLAWSFTRYRANPSIGVPALVTVDIWKFDASGRVAEHWDVLEPDFTSPGGHTFEGLIGPRR
ncbi:MAG: hypothetical protein AAFZ87_02540 [Planctomycetota bacterium]